MTTRLQEFERKLRKKKIRTREESSDDDAPESLCSNLSTTYNTTPSPTAVTLLVVILSIANVYHHVTQLGGFAPMNGQLMNMTTEILNVNLQMNETLNEMAAKVEGVYSKIHKIGASATLLAEAFNSLQAGGLKPGTGSAQYMPDNANRTHWCVLVHNKLPIAADRFDHFPHTMEVALPCWSWFRSQHATNDCGFILVGDLQLDRSGQNSWQNQLIRQHMKCKVQQVADEQSLQQIKTTKTDEVYHHPNLKFMKPRAGYRNYLREVEDAQALRRVVGVSDEWVAMQKGNGKPLQVGIIQRTNRRVVTNMDDIARGLQAALPRANVTLSTLQEAPTVLDQARWFASKHIIVGAHGAALTNSVFVTKGTFVLQLYPPNFHWQSLDPLIEQSGGIALDWSKGENPIADFIAAAKDWKVKNHAQHMDFEVPVDEVLEIVLVALEKKLPNAEMLRRSQY